MTYFINFQTVDVADVFKCIHTSIYSRIFKKLEEHCNGIRLHLFRLYFSLKMEVGLLVSFFYKMETLIEWRQKKKVVN